jgi:actin-like ATPase involved in cell morphogenesis
MYSVSSWTVSSGSSAFSTALHRLDPVLSRLALGGPSVTAWAGGGALLRNLDVLLREETGLPLMLADDPLTAVWMGARKVLDELLLLRGMTNPQSPVDMAVRITVED